MISSSCFSRAIAIISPRKILGRSVPWCLPCDCLMLQIFNVCPWGIENQLHHIRDLSFGHDACRVRSGLAPQILSAIRNLTIPLLLQIHPKNIAAANQIPWGKTITCTQNGQLETRMKRPCRYTSPKFPRVIDLISRSNQFRCSFPPKNPNWLVTGRGLRLVRINLGQV
jgi:hypothetical protein